uniref:Uncharacterized protein n=1 Tax=Arundo donax TaxID=35708 RepID=A0A0A8Y7W6_ARUDO
MNTFCTTTKFPYGNSYSSGRT